MKRIKEIIILSIFIFSSLIFNAAFALEFPFYIYNFTKSNCSSTLKNGQIVKIKSSPGSTILVNSISPSIAPFASGYMDIVLDGKGRGSITFQYEVIQANQSNSYLKITYNTDDISNPVILDIPANLNFKYNDKMGYVLSCIKQ